MNSHARKVRELWGAHLSIDDQELLLLPRTLSLDTDSTSLEGHRENLALLLESRDLRRIPVSESSFVYDEVAFQWLAQGRLDFNRQTFREACKREGLLDWAAAGFDDTLLRWQMKPEVVNGEKKDIQSRVQTRGGQTGR